MSTTKWVVDPSHSEIQFKIKHLMISTVTGQFAKFEGDAETEGDDFSTGTTRFKADVNSISTNNEQRDAHLRNGDFFDSENHPELVFESTQIEKISDEEYKVHGNLTLRGVTNPIVLDAEYGGTVADPWGNTRAGFTFAGKLHRKDYGISFGLIGDTAGGLANEVKVLGSIQLVKQQ
jgi:polyisoprenoid-binding protein YceI